MPDDKADLIYGTVMQHACGCRRKFKHEIDLREHLAFGVTNEHYDASYRRARTKAEWDREQREFSSLQQRIGKQPKRRDP